MISQLTILPHWNSALLAEFYKAGSKASSSDYPNIDMSKINTVEETVKICVCEERVLGVNK